MATIADVAKLAGVTPTTVSRVINNRGYISDKTRKKVYDAMNELHYQPNEIAQSLVKKRTNTIGIVVPHISHPYFAKLISNLENEAAKKGYKIMLYNSKDKYEKEKQCLEMCRSSRVAGIVLCSSNIESSLIKSLDVPVVLLEKNFEDDMLGIQCDNFQGGKLATEHLISCGCKKILHFSGVIGSDMPADNRERAFKQVCEENSIQYYISKYDLDIYNDMDYHKYIRDKINDIKGVDGIFASSDLIAAQVIQVCNDLGLNVPRDIKLVGFDDVDISKLTTPTITTIHQPIKEMAKLAIDLIQDNNVDMEMKKHNVLPVELIIRNSTLTER